MRIRSRPCLTYANVMATIAVFGVVAGGGAYAASKIGASDIARNAVRSKHVKAGAVKTAKIAEGAVTRAKLADGIGPPALKLDFDQPDTDNTLRTLGVQDELAIKARCLPDNDFGSTSLQLYVQSSVAATINYFGTNDAGGGASVITGPNDPSLAAGVNRQLSWFTNPGGFRRLQFQMTYRNPNRVISIQLLMRADDVSGRCQLHGTAVPAS